MTRADTPKRRAWSPVDLRVDQPHPARIYDALLGGKTNYAADRLQAEKVKESMPNAVLVAKANRAFMQRAVRFLAAEAGIRQFLDIGTGIPTSPNLHEVAQEVDSTARVVYVDNDPIVLAHSRALHAGTPDGHTAYLEADATEPQQILSDPELLETILPGRPVAVTLCLLLHWLPRTFDSYAMVRTLTEHLPAGSGLVISVFTKDFEPELSRVEDDFEGTGSTLDARSHDQVERFFTETGFELVPPGVQVPHLWRPDPLQYGIPEHLEGKDIPLWAGVGLKTED
jgi:S-adenosyl methyltransferase